MDVSDVQEHRALRIPEVLEAILKYVDLPTLKHCCLVSRAWAHAGQSRLRASELSAYVNNINGPVSVNFKPLPKFLKLLKAKNSGDSTHIYLNVVLFVSLQLNKKSQLTRLWSACGQNVKSVQIFHFDCPTIDSFRNLILRTFPNMENLVIGNLKILNNEISSKDHAYGKHLKLKTLTIYCMAMWDSPISWQELFEKFPSLQNLTLNDPGTEAFSAINKIRQRDPDALQLSRICIDGEGSITPEFMEFIDSPSIHLQSLSIDTIALDVEAALNKIFSAHSTTLTSLTLTRKISRRYRRLVPLTRVPGSLKNNCLEEEKLLKLVELSLISRVFASMEFLRLMPNLKRLSMTGLNDDAPSIISGTNFAFMKHVKLVHCFELEMDNFVPLEDLAELVQWLPNVERLKMSMDNDTFAFVCRHWPNLTSLDIVDTKVDECGFTGLNHELVDIINRGKGNLPKRLKVIQIPNISGLKHLLKLSMSRENESSIISMAYAAAVFGIQKLPFLNYVDIRGISFDENILLESFRKSVGSQQAYSRIVS